jgi:uncharacterized membrane protein YbhN (UPF0104 family)
MIRRIEVPDRLTFLVKIAVTAFCLWYLYTAVPLGELGNAVDRIESEHLVVLLGVIGLRELTTSYSLKVLLSEYTRTPLWTAVKIDCMGATTNTFIPSRAGALLSVPVIINRLTGVEYQAALKIKAIQFVFIAGYTGVLAGIGLLMVGGSLDGTLITAAGLSIVLYLGFVCSAVGARLVFPSLGDYLPKHAKALTASSRFSRRSIAVAGGVIGVGFATGVVRFFVVSTALGASFPPEQYLVLPFLLYVVTVLPISFGGIGVAETFGITVLAAVGVPITLATTIVVTDRIIGTYVPLIVSFSVANVSLFDPAEVT